MPSPRISIVIPTYRRAANLRECLQSVLKESDSDLEIVVSDNASPDDTPQVVSSFRDPRLRYVRNESNLGLSMNVHNVWKFARGSHAFFLTDDDLLLPGALREVRRILREDPEIGLILSHLERFNDEGTPVSSWSGFPNSRRFSAGADALESLFHPCFVLSRTVLRRDLIDWEGHLRHIDSLFAQMYVTGIALKKAPAYYTAFPLVKHRVNNKVYYDRPPDHGYASIIRIIREVLPEEEFKSCKRALIDQTVRDPWFTLQYLAANSIPEFLGFCAALLRIPEMRESGIFWTNVARAIKRGAIDRLRRGRPGAGAAVGKPT
ncbi:MAG: glycosyltransferase family 2 protein [Nitrospirae bacterium]|nr:glycosyltransferase family 2 protein [Nitrospirota bacterium]